MKKVCFFEGPLFREASGVSFGAFLGALGSPWGRLGPPLGPQGRLWGGLGRPLGRLGMPFGAIWVLLGALGVPLGVFLEPLGDPSGTLGGHVKYIAKTSLGNRSKYVQNTQLSSIFEGPIFLQGAPESLLEGAFLI